MRRCRLFGGDHFVHCGEKAVQEQQRIQQSSIVYWWGEVKGRRNPRDELLTDLVAAGWAGRRNLHVIRVWSM